MSAENNKHSGCSSLVMSSQNFGGITRLICTYGVPLQPSSGLSDGEGTAATDI